MDSRYHVTDNDFRKGAFEEDNPFDKPQTSMAGQLPHRGGDPTAEGLDSDFPEPGGNPEHSGGPEEPAERVEQDPGERQKRNQDRQDDPLAA